MTIYRVSGNYHKDNTFNYVTCLISANREDEAKNLAIKYYGDPNAVFDIHPYLFYDHPIFEGIHREVT